MSRKARKNTIALSQIYHIVSRGNNEKRIFRSPRDYRKFVLILSEVKRKFPFYLYCYSLMPNHYHLEIETKNYSVSKIMHRVNFLYAIYFKRRYQTSGHLFQDRFYSSPIEKLSYFREASRYIDLNPVRAKLVESPEEWKWGSFTSYFAKNNQKILIDEEKFLSFWGGDIEMGRNNYIEYVNAGLEIEKLPDFILEKMM
jgi:putative transposase